MLKLRIILCFFFSTFLVFHACKTSTKPARGKETIIVPDKSITPQNAFINLFLDSSEVQHFLSESSVNSGDSSSIMDFYKERNYQYAWFDTSGLTEHASAFVNLYRNYRSTTHDTALNFKKLDAAIDDINEDSNYLAAHPKVLVPAELNLTIQFFKYAAKAYSGNPAIDPTDLGWFIPRKKINITSFLDSVVNNKTKDISAFEPVHPMFTPLHNYLLKYSEIEKNGGWPPIIADKKTYKEGDSATAVSQIKKRLQVVEDLPATDTGNLFTADTKKAVINFQHRYGMKEDGIVSKSVITEMNRPVADRIKQLIVNIERIRWVPKPGTGRYIIVNIPAFTLYAFDQGKLQYRMKVVVGKAANSTVIFSDELETIAFSPYWNVPYSIVKNEMQGKSGAYFTRQNMEVVGHYNDGLPMVRQKPGPRNSLGRVKFLFPNSYAIYFHDTPSKGLFNATKRAFSHGCIRLAEPEKMAAWLLQDKPEWTADSIKKMMDLDVEKQVKLDKKVPVFIGYFSAWVDSEGKLNFRDDIYGHDKEMLGRLFAEK